jgi:hypothetical protein
VNWNSGRLCIYEDQLKYWLISLKRIDITIPALTRVLTNVMTWIFVTSFLRPFMAFAWRGIFNVFGENAFNILNATKVFNLLCAYLNGYRNSRSTKEMNDSLTHSIFSEICNISPKYEQSKHVVCVCDSSYVQSTRKLRRFVIKTMRKWCDWNKIKLHYTFLYIES